MDSAHRKVDSLLEKLEKKISDVYKRANDELKEKTKDYFERLERRDKAKQEKVEKGQMTQAQYEAWKKQAMMTGDHWVRMQNTVASEMLQANKTAMQYVNNTLPQVYSLGYNAIGEQLEPVSGISFELVDANTVKNLVTSGKTLLPYKTVDGKKDERWNTKKVNSEILQGIVQGESIPNIAKRLRNVTEMNRASAIRNARTSTTSAENKGRMDSYDYAESIGVIMQKMWMSTHDGRTRAEHSELDGVTEDVNEPFVNGFGEIMYPGDPDAEPENVYNCRCTLVADVKGFRSTKTGKVTHLLNLGNAAKLPSTSFKQDTKDYSLRMKQDDINKFSEVLGNIEFVDDYDGASYLPDDNKINIGKDDHPDYTLFHEATHWYDYNQSYTITDDWGHYKRDEDGNLTNEWVPKIVVVKENAGFSEYISSKWEMYERGSAETKESLDRQNFVRLIGTSDTYGPGRKEAANDVQKINEWLKGKGISRADKDYGHLSDFISALTYDANLGSLTTGGHDYDYWTKDPAYRVTEITAGYNVLKSLGRDDIIKVEKELAPNLMEMIEKEWGKIW